MEPLKRVLDLCGRISTASGSERGSHNETIVGTTLATARGTDSRFYSKRMAAACALGACAPRREINPTPRDD